MLWGKRDAVALTGTGEIAAGTDDLVGTGTAFTTELDPRDVVHLGADSFVVVDIISDTAATIEPISASGIAANTAISGSDTPKFLTVTQATTEASILTTAEAQDANNRALGMKTAGWNLYDTYTAADGSVRHKVEPIVAFKS